MKTLNLTLGVIALSLSVFCIMVSGDTPEMVPFGILNLLSGTLNIWLYTTT